MLIHEALNLRIHRTHKKTNQEAKKPAQWDKHLLSKGEDMSPNLRNPHRNWGHICNPSVEIGNLGRGMQEDPRSLPASQPSQNGKLQVEGRILHKWTSGQEKKSDKLFSRKIQKFSSYIHRNNISSKHTSKSGQHARCGSAHL